MLRRESKRDPRFGAAASAVMAANRLRKFAALGGDPGSARSSKEGSSSRRSSGGSASSASASSSSKVDVMALVHRLRNTAASSSVDSGFNHAGFLSTISEGSEFGRRDVPGRDGTGAYPTYSYHDKEPPPSLADKLLAESLTLSGEEPSGEPPELAVAAAAASMARWSSSNSILSNASTKAKQQEEAQRRRQQRLDEERAEEEDKKKRRASRLRVYLPVGDEEGEEEMFWEKYAPPNKPRLRRRHGAVDDDNAVGRRRKPRAKNWWEPGYDGKREPMQPPKSQSRKEPEGGMTLAEANASRRLNEELGYRPGLLRDPKEYVVCADDGRQLGMMKGDVPDPFAWMSSAAEARNASAAAAAGEGRRRRRRLARARKESKERGTGGGTVGGAGATWNDDEDDEDEDEDDSGGEKFRGEARSPSGGETTLATDPLSPALMRFLCVGKESMSPPRQIFGEEDDEDDDENDDDGENDDEKREEEKKKKKKKRPREREAMGTRVPGVPPPPPWKPSNGAEEQAAAHAESFMTPHERLGVTGRFVDQSQQQMATAAAATSLSSVLSGGEGSVRSGSIRSGVVQKHYQFGGGGSEDGGSTTSIGGESSSLVLSPERPGGLEGTFQWAAEPVDDTQSVSLRSGKARRGTPEGRTHHTMTAVPAAWSPPGTTEAVWLRPGMGIFFMYGGRIFTGDRPRKKGAVKGMGGSDAGTSARGGPSSSAASASAASASSSYSSSSSSSSSSSGRVGTNVGGTNTVPCKELWSYTPDLMRWQDLTEFYTGMGPEARSRHSCSAVHAPSGVQLFVYGGLDYHNVSAVSAKWSAVSASSYCFSRHDAYTTYSLPSAEPSRRFMGAGLGDARVDRGAHFGRPAAPGARGVLPDTDGAGPRGDQGQDRGPRQPGGARGGRALGHGRLAAAPRAVAGGQGRRARGWGGRQLGAGRGGGGAAARALPAAQQRVGVVGHVPELGPGPGQ